MLPHKTHRGQLALQRWVVEGIAPVLEDEEDGRARRAAHHQAQASTQLSVGELANLSLEAQELVERLEESRHAKSLLSTSQRRPCREAAARSKTVDTSAFDAVLLRLAMPCKHPLMNHETKKTKYLNIFPPA